MRTELKEICDNQIPKYINAAIFYISDAFSLSDAERKKLLNVLIGESEDESDFRQRGI